MTGVNKVVLAELVRDLPGVVLFGDPQIQVSGIAYDSRKVVPGDLFVAVPGTKDDGGRFIPKAIQAGAVACLAKADPKNGTTTIVADDVRLAMGRIAARFHRHPDRDLQVIGVTGTNGKTTITYVLEAILAAAGEKPGVIGTIAYRFGDMTREAPTTTPESVDVFEIINEMKNLGATAVIMEISSHALDQKRVAGLWVRSAIFTNLSRDHLDYHHDFEDYYQAKRKLFTEVVTGAWEHGRDSGAPTPTAAINLDDQYGARLFQECQGLDQIGYGINATAAAVRATDASFSASGIKATVDTPAGQLYVDSSLVGRHNLENVLAAIAAAIKMGVAIKDVESGIKDLQKVPGRLEPVFNSMGVTVLVDYAHTPDALEHAVDTCAELAPGRLITVFGCGGDRDPGKRPLMGKIAARGSDLSVVTSDNPRTEQPHAIIEQIMVGVLETEVPEFTETSGKGYLVEPDRAQAIARAVKLAEAGDLILIAGKGHEDYQILGTEKIHFDDREHAAVALEGKGK